MHISMNGCARSACPPDAPECATDGQALHQLMAKHGQALNHTKTHAHTYTFTRRCSPFIGLHNTLLTQARTHTCLNLQVLTKHRITHNTRQHTPGWMCRCSPSIGSATAARRWSCRRRSPPSARAPSSVSEAQHR